MIIQENLNYSYIKDLETLPGTVEIQIPDVQILDSFKCQEACLVFKSPFWSCYYLDHFKTRSSGPVVV